ncbi:MAG TPA: hypothetical protein VFX86_00295, partial [Candidatus Saccharimonadales bacterium]|nr:hypothetical protein [Candidatus Saccharimonadales bacterium]
MRNVMAGRAELDMFDAQDVTRLRGRELSTSRGVVGLLVEYEQKAFRFNTVIHGVRRSLSGLHIVSVNVEDPFERTGEGKPMKIKAWRGHVAG